MLKPGVVMRSASRAAESSAVSRLIPEEGVEEDEAMTGEEAETTPRFEICDLHSGTKKQQRDYNANADGRNVIVKQRHGSSCAM